MINNGYKSEKKWRDALMRAVNRHSNGKGSPKKLEMIVDKCADEAMGGEAWAVKEIGDRLDGKPAQAVDLGVRVQVTAIERRIVDVIDAECEVVSLSNKSDT